MPATTCGTLIRRDQERAARLARMQRLVDEGLASGISEETMEDIAAAARADRLAGRPGHDL